MRLFVIITLAISLCGIAGCKSGDTDITNDPLPNLVPWWK